MIDHLSIRVVACEFPTIRTISYFFDQIFQVISSQFNSVTGLKIKRIGAFSELIEKYCCKKVILASFNSISFLLLYLDILSSRFQFLACLTGMYRIKKENTYDQQKVKKGKQSK